jgi:hypothetical protein
MSNEGVVNDERWCYTDDDDDDDVVMMGSEHHIDDEIHTHRKQRDSQCKYLDG